MLETQTNATESTTPATSRKLGTATRVFLLATASFLAMLALTVKLPEGPYNDHHSYAHWATMHTLTTPMSALGMGLNTPPTLNFLAGLSVHVALWTVLFSVAQLVRSRAAAPAVEEAELEEAFAGDLATAAA